MLSSPEFKINFSRFLFFRELSELKGLKYMLENVHFGNKINLIIEQLNISMFKDDFQFFMTVLFNNITFDD